LTVRTARSPSSRRPAQSPARSAEQRRDVPNFDGREAIPHPGQDLRRVPASVRLELAPHGRRGARPAGHDSAPTCSGGSARRRTRARARAARSSGESRLSRSKVVVSQVGYWVLRCQAVSSRTVMPCPTPVHMVTEPPGRAGHTRPFGRRRGGARIAVVRDGRRGPPPGHLLLRRPGIRRSCSPSTPRTSPGTAGGRPGS
jgi:hypothetical protein